MNVNVSNDWVTTMVMKLGIWLSRGKAIPNLLSDGSTDYLYGPGGLPIEQTGPSGSFWYLHDQVGSTMGLLDTTGAVAGTYSYTTYGLAAHSGSASTPLEFAGQYTDAESGLIYLRDRYYDPVTAQFLTVDPDVSATHLRYAYANDNPLNLSDPTGDCALAAMGKGGGGYRPGGQKPPQLSAAEQEALDAYKHNRPYDPKVLKSAQAKERQGQKYSGQRNAQKRANNSKNNSKNNNNDNTNNFSVGDVLLGAGIVVGVVAVVVIAVVALPVEAIAAAGAALVAGIGALFSFAW